VTNDNKLFVHGGFSWHRPIKEQEPYDLYWDRNLLAMALYWQSQGEKSLKENRVRDYEEVFVGHTTTSRIQPDLLPVHASNVWGLDQGAGFEGKLTLMNIDTKEYFQSSIVSTLYPDEKGRR
jgi:serine/threonine protein phosphatase 1